MQKPTLNERQEQLEASGMSRRQATAYKLAGTPPHDARFHGDIPVRGGAAYSILAIVWIHDIPHWRTAVTLHDAKGVVLPEKSALMAQVGAYDAADKLLDGVGEGASVMTTMHVSFRATKPLTSSERAGLVVVDGRVLVVDAGGRVHHEMLTVD